MHRTWYTRHAVNDSSLSVVNALRFQPVHLVLATEVDFTLIEVPGWRPNGLECCIHDALSVRKDRVLFFTLIRC